MAPSLKQAGNTQASNGYRVGRSFLSFPLLLMAELLSAVSFLKSAHRNGGGSSRLELPKESGYN